MEHNPPLVSLPTTMRILIADDSALFRLLLNKLLTDMGYEVIVCEDGQSALDHLREDHAAQIAILDWMMPGLDGLQVCEEVRKLPNRPYVYLLLLTAKNTKEDLLKAFNAGFDDFLTKPVDAEELNVRLAGGPAHPGLAESTDEGSGTVAHPGHARRPDRPVEPPGHLRHARK